MRRHGSPQSLEAVRLQAVALQDEGLSSAEIAELVDRAPRTVEKWLKRAREHGVQALQAKPHAGATPKLSAPQRKRLCELLIAGAQAAGFDTDLWTCPRVRQLIRSQFDVTYHVDYLPVLLRSLGFTCQKPQLVPRERNLEAVETWVKRTWPRIKKTPASVAHTSCLSTKAACC